MVEVELVKYIDGSFPSINSDESATDFISILTAKCFEIAMEENKETADALSKTSDHDKVQEFFKTVFQRCDNLWVYCCAHIKSRFNIEMNRYCMILLLRELSYKDAYKDDAHFALKEYLDSIEEKERARGGSSKKQYDSVKSFFKAFEELGTYYVDPSKYQSTEDFAKYQKLMEAFADMMANTTYHFDE